MVKLFSNFITKEKEKDSILSLFRISLIFFSDTPKLPSDKSNDDPYMHIFEEEEFDDDDDDDGVTPSSSSNAPNNENPANGKSGKAANNDTDNDNDNDENDSKSNADNSKNTPSEASGTGNNNPNKSNNAGANEGNNNTGDDKKNNNSISDNGNDTEGSANKNIGKDADSGKKDDEDNDSEKKDDKENDSGKKNDKDKGSEKKDDKDKGFDKKDDKGNLKDLDKGKDETLDKARNMKPKSDTPSSVPKSANGPDIPNKKNDASRINDAKKTANAVKNAANDPEQAAAQASGEAFKKGAEVLANSVAPGTGRLAKKFAGGIIDKVNSSKSGRYCCFASMGCTCLTSIVMLLFILTPVLIPIITIATIYQALGLDEDKEINFIEVIQEETLNKPKVSLLTILNDALKAVNYEKFKAKKEDPKNVGIGDTNASALVFTLLQDNYSVADLKRPAATTKTDDFPYQDIRDTGLYITDSQKIDTGNNLLSYSSMDSKHIPLFEDVLNNVLESDKSPPKYTGLTETEQIAANKLKSLFDYEDKVVDFIDETTKLLNKEQTFYNPSSYLTETASLRELLEGLSTEGGDTGTFNLEDDSFYSKASSQGYDLYTVQNIMLNSKNIGIADELYDLQERLTKLEVMVYMQAYRQYQMQIQTVRDQAEKKGYILPDIYYEDEFFNQFSTITDVAEYVSLSLTCGDSSIIYEIACETIDIYKEGLEVKVVTFNGQKIGYIPILKTWYANYTFDLVTTGQDAQLICTGSTSREIDEQTLTDRSNILKRYNINNKEQFFALFKTATGIDPIEGVDNIYTPANMDENWSYTVTFPVSASDATVSLGYQEEYSASTLESLSGLTSKVHKGIDYAVASGTEVVAVKSGTVTNVVNSNTGYGNYIQVTDKSGYTTTYAHGNGTFYVSEGEQVAQGQPIMESGNSGNSTGPHLHVEVREPDGSTVDPNSYYRSVA